MQFIRLDASYASDFVWEEEGEGIYFLDFNLYELDPFNLGQFHAHVFAIEEFNRRFPHVKKVVLARTAGEFSKIFKKSENMECLRSDAKVDIETFYAQLFSEYLHRLSSMLAEDITPLLLCEFSKKQNIEHFILPFCKRRFEYISLIFSEEVLPIEGKQSTIVALPQDELYSPGSFAPIFKDLKGKDFKCIPEELLNEHWDGVDNIIVVSEFLGPIGKRMLCGFEAAGGTIIYR